VHRNKQLEEDMQDTFGPTPRNYDGSDSPESRIGRCGRLTGPDRRSQVLRSAATQFAKTGLRGTTTRTLAKAAGVSEAILYVHFGSKESLFRKVVEDNVKTRLQLLESRLLSAMYESATGAIQFIAEATVTVCVTGAGNSVLTSWALLEDPEHAADLHRDEMGSVEIIWNRAITEHFRDSRPRRVLSVHLVPYAISSCLAYGFWLATLHHNGDSAAALAQEFGARMARTAAALLLEKAKVRAR
jgi:AcrR family transcriptional regulator